MSRKRRLLRWSFTLISGVSLIACIAFAGLRIRNHWVNDLFMWEDRLAETTCYTHIGDLHGTIMYRRDVVPNTHTFKLEKHRFAYEATNDYVVMCRCRQVTGRPNEQHAVVAGYGFMWHRANDDDNLARFGFALPMWLFCAVTFILPGVWLKGFIFRARTREGHCKVCGYDLRCTPTRCPECGTQVA